MSPLLIMMFITGGLCITLLVYSILMHIKDKKVLEENISEDPRKKNTPIVKYNKVQQSTFRVIFGNALLIVTGIMLIVTFTKIKTYNTYGAFYDSSWRMPDVEAHFLFDTYDTNELEDILANDPDNFKVEDYKICLVKLGCEDCEKLEEIIRMHDEQGFYIIHSRSAVGQYLTEKYSINYVPCVMIEGDITHLYADTPPLEKE